MEDKQYLDEAGLSEVGKVISKFYANKDEIKDLDSLKDFVSSHSEIKLHYITKEEYDKMLNVGKFPKLSDIYDPISIVRIEDYSDEVCLWDDEPINALYEAGLKVDENIEANGQCYLLFNITPNHKITNDKIDNIKFNGYPLKDNNVRLQIAFGEKDHLLYWRLLNEATDNIVWTFVQDPYATQWADIANYECYNLSKQLETKAGKSDVPTKLSQLEEDEKHRTVTSEEKEKWNNVKSIEVVNDLTTGGADKVLSAEQGKVLNDTKIDKTSIIDNLETDDATKPLSARQGKMLFQYANEGKEKIANALIGKGVENVSKDSSFSDLTKGIDEVKTGYGVGDLIKIDDLEETVLNVPSQLISSKDFTLGTNIILQQGSATFYGYGDCIYVATLYDEDSYGRDVHHIGINQMNLTNGSSKLVVDVSALYTRILWNRWFIAHGNLYLSANNGNLHIYTLDGTLIKRVKISDSALTSWQTDSNNNIYLINIDGDIFKLSPNYEITKLATIQAHNLSINDFAIINDNVLQVLYCDNRDYGIKYFQYFSYNLTTNEGTTESNRLKSETSNTYAYRYTDRDGNLLFTNSRGEKDFDKKYLIKLNKKFDVVWEKQIETHYGHYRNAIDSCIYFTNSNKLFVFDDQFNFIWSFQASDNISHVVKINNYLCIIKNNEEVVNVDTIQTPYTTKAYKVLK